MGVSRRGPAEKENNDQKRKQGEQGEAERMAAMERVMMGENEEDG